MMRRGTGGWLRRCEKSSWACEMTETLIGRRRNQSPLPSEELAYSRVPSLTDEILEIESGDHPMKQQDREAAVYKIFRKFIISCRGQAPLGTGRKRERC